MTIFQDNNDKIDPNYQEEGKISLAEKIRVVKSIYLKYDFYKFLQFLCRNLNSPRFSK